MVAGKWWQESKVTIALHKNGTDIGMMVTGAHVKRSEEDMEFAHGLSSLIFALLSLSDEEWEELKNQESEEG